MSSPSVFIQKRHRRLAELQPKLRQVVGRIRTAPLRSDQDDLEQSVIEHTLRLLEEHPDAHDWFLLKCARRNVLNIAFADRIYRSYARATACPMPAFIDNDGEAVDYDECVPGPDSTPEEHLIAKQSLETLQASLTPAQNKVLDLLLDGYRKSEIAEMLDVGPNAITYFVHYIHAAWERQTAD